MIINVWRVLLHDVRLKNYDLENAVFNLFKIKEPSFSNWILT